MGRAAARFVGKQRCVTPVVQPVFSAKESDALSDLLEHQFIALLERGAVGFVELAPAPDGWYVRINGSQWLRSSRQCPHRFVRLEKTLMYLRELGCARVMVDLSAWPDAPWSRFPSCVSPCGMDH